MKKLKCHCGHVEAEINLPSGLEKIIRCNCSIYKRKGAIMFYERLTKHMLKNLTHKSDAIIEIDNKHRLKSIKFN